MDEGPSEVKLKVEFAGGLELLFSKKRSHTISIPSKVSSSKQGGSSESKAQENAGLSTPNVNYLIHWLKDNLLKERAELFVEGETVYVAQLPVRCTYTDSCQSSRDFSFDQR